MINRIFFTVIFTLGLIGSGFCQEITFSNPQEVLNINQKVYLLEDKNGELTIDDIQKPNYQSQFKISKQKNPNFGITKSTIWCKITINNTTLEEIYLQISEANLWYLDFYRPDSLGKYTQVCQTGTMRPYQSREIDHNLYLFKLLPAKKIQSSTFYLKISSEYPLSIPVEVAPLKVLMKNDRMLDLLFGGFFGLLFVMIIYNGFLYFNTQDKSYLYYVVFLIFTLPTQMCLNNNYLYEFFKVNFIFKYFNLLFVSPLIIASTLFVSNFLQLKTHNKRYYNILLGFRIMMVILGILNIFWYSEILGALQATALLSQFCAIYISYKRLRKGFLPAKYLLMGWSVYVVCIFVFNFSLRGLLPFNFFTKYALVFGLAWEIVFFAFALANKIKVLRKEKDIAQKASLLQSQENERIIKEQNEILEQKVKERTFELQESQEEILVQNEELQQQAEEISAQRDTLEDKNKLLENYKYRISSSIRAAELIQGAILPQTEEIQKLVQDIFILYRPKDIVSGDLWWMGKQNNKIFMAVIDCTGHGVAGAFMTLITHNIMDKIVHAFKIESPAQILEAAHLELKHILHQEQTGNNDGMDICLIALEYKENACELTYCGAKRPLYFFDPTSNTLDKLKETRRSIGGSQNTDTLFEDTVLQLPLGSIIYLSSDGYADQNNPERKKIGTKEFVDLLESAKILPLAQQHDLLNETLINHMQNTEQRDDITVVGIKV